LSNFTKILEQIRIYNEKNPSWIVAEEMGEFLYQKAKKIEAKNILEIGTSIGYSGLWLAKAAQENKGVLYTIESHGKRFEMAKENFKKAGFSNCIVQIKGHAPEVIPEIYGKWDLVFFDATKCEHNQYFESILPNLKKGSILIVDNVISHKNAMRDFLEKIENVKEFLVEKHEKLGQGALLIVIRPPVRP